MTDAERPSHRRVPVNAVCLPPVSGVALIVVAAVLLRAIVALAAVCRLQHRRRRPLHGKHSSAKPSRSS